MSRSGPVNADTLGPARPHARDIIAESLSRFALVAPRPGRRDRPFPTDAASAALSALTSAGFLVVHQDAMPPAVRAAVAGYQDAP